MNRVPHSARRIGAAAVITFLALGLTAGVSYADAPAAVPTTAPPIADRAATGVTADALPTVQIDGVVWSQAIVGNTVYAGGEFANARPAGAAPGTDQTPVNNLIAYNLTTGAMISTFVPDVNGVVNSVVASPDGSRVYIGGTFTTVDGADRYRIAAFDTATGTLIQSFQPVVNATVNSLSVSKSGVVYAGGVFTASNTTTRTRLAAFSAASGALLGWNPTVADTLDSPANAQDTVDAVQLTPDGKYVVVGGAFSSVNGAQALGLASIDATTGASVPFQANQTVKNYGKQGAILSLSTDGKAIYGTGYTYGSPSNFEGTFSADPDTGAINWLADCHGDTYGAYASSSQVYVVSHEHFCSNIGGFPDTNPRSRWQRTTAFTVGAAGTVQTNSQTGSGYGNFGGQPSPSLVNWFPTLDIGTYTKQNQAAWTVTGNSQYVVEGGEFPTVNGTPQQGLVRFAVPSIAPKKRGPMDSAAATSTPSATATSMTSATITWPANWDQDDQSLTYQVYRQRLSTPVCTLTAVSQFWNRPTLPTSSSPPCVDNGLQPGTTYQYRVVATDRDGNSTPTAYVSVTTPGTPPAATTTTVAASPASAVVGQPVELDVSVQPASGDGPSDDNATVSVDGTTSTVPLTAGRGTLTTAFTTPGTHTVTATFANSAFFNASTGSTTVTVAQAATTVTATAPTAKLVAGQSAAIPVRVAAVAPGVGTPAGSVTYSVDSGAASAATALTAGAATVHTAALHAGAHTLTVRYSGNTSFAASSTPVAVTVGKDSTTLTASVSPAKPVTGQRLSVRTTVHTTAPGTASATGTVTVRVDGKAAKPTTLSKAAATTALAGLNAGRHTIAVTYSGDADHATSKTSQVVTVRAAHAAARVTSSAPRTSKHTTVHFRATVAASAPATGHPSGSVVFYVDGHKRAMKTLHSGTATWTIKLPKGHHQVHVRYVGTSGYDPVTSANITQIER